MSLYETWIKKAYDKTGKANNKLWDDYMPREQKVYEEIIPKKINTISGSVKDLAKKYDMPVEYMCGFLDGINDALEEKIDIENLEENTDINIKFDFETLYEKMVEYKAAHLYTLPQWNEIFDEERQKELFTEQKKSKTFVRQEQKIGRNDPCACGSGKKHKKCCGAIA